MNYCEFCDRNGNRDKAFQKLDMDDDLLF